jgi:hypothetical protein
MQYMGKGCSISFLTFTIILHLPSLFFYHFHTSVSFPSLSFNIGNIVTCQRELDRISSLVVKSSWLQNGDVLCFLWGTNWIYICCVEESRPPLWSGGQSSWLQKINVMCFMWGTNWIYICYVEESRLPLWSGGQSSWLQNGNVLCFLWGTKWIYI